MQDNMGVPASPSGQQPTASAASADAPASSQSAVPNAAAILYGYVQEVYNKRGLRTVHFDAVYPYRHVAWIDVVGDPGAEDDNSLTEALYPFCTGLVSVTADVDPDGELSATPSRFQFYAEGGPASGIEAASADETALAGSAVGESPVGEAETPND